MDLFKIYSWIRNQNIINFRLKKGGYKSVKLHEESELLIQGISKTIKNEPKEPKEGFLPMLLETLAVCIIGNLFAGKGVIRAGVSNKSRLKFLLRSYPLTNFGIQEYYQN